MAQGEAEAAPFGVVGGTCLANHQPATINTAPKSPTQDDNRVPSLDARPDHDVQCLGEHI